VRQMKIVDSEPNCRNCEQNESNNGLNNRSLILLHIITDCYCKI